MRILLVNDDGYKAKGLRVLFDALSKNHDCLVCAPLGECSATGHGITLRDPLRLRKFNHAGAEFHGISGLPADAAKYGLTVLCENHKPELVISGINAGANTGQNLFYSGTVAAAAEGVFNGIPSIAISLSAGNDADFEPAGRIALEVASRFEKHPFDGDTLLNVNVPACPDSEIKGYRLAKMGYARFHEVFTRREDPHGQEYYWMDGAKDGNDIDIETDDFLVHDNWISLAPLKLDLTHPEWRSVLTNWNLNDAEK